MTLSLQRRASLVTTVSAPNVCLLPFSIIRNRSSEAWRLQTIMLYYFIVTVPILDRGIRALRNVMASDWHVFRPIQMARC